jgi:hypothetical protein
VESNRRDRKERKGGKDGELPGDRDRPGRTSRRPADWPGAPAISRALGSFTPRMSSAGRRRLRPGRSRSPRKMLNPFSACGKTVGTTVGVSGHLQPQPAIKTQPNRKNSLWTRRHSRRSQIQVHGVWLMSHECPTIQSRSRPRKEAERERRFMVGRAYPQLARRSPAKAGAERSQSRIPSNPSFPRKPSGFAPFVVKSVPRKRGVAELLRRAAKAANKMTSAICWKRRTVNVSA